MDDDACTYGAVRAGTRSDAAFFVRAGTVRGISKIAVVVGQDLDVGK